MKFRYTLLAALGSVALSGSLTAGEVRVVESGSALERAVMLASPGADASLEDIMLSVYEAVQNDPDAAVEIFTTVVAQRENWTADQLYSIMLAVEMGNPGMHNNPALIAALAEVSVPGSVVADVTQLVNLDSYMLPGMNSRFARGRMGGGTMGINTNYPSGPIEEVIPSPGPVSDDK